MVRFDAMYNLFKAIFLQNSVRPLVNMSFFTVISVAQLKLTTSIDI